MTFGGLPTRDSIGAPSAYAVAVLIGEDPRSLIPTLIPLGTVLAILAMDVLLYADARAQSRKGRPVIFSAGTVVIGTPEAWLLGSLLLWIVVVPLYWSIRHGRR